MTKYQNILTSSSACLTTETMQKYIAENLSDSDKRNVEMHLADCEMCSDELEGLSLLKNPGNLAFIINNLNEKIDLKAKSKLVFLQRIRPYYSAAALILVLISISTFLLLNDFSTSNQEMADSMSKEEMTFSTEPTIETEKLSEEKSISTDTFISSLENNEKLLADNSSSKKRKEKLVIVDDISEISDDFEVSDNFDEYLEEDSSNLVASGNTGFVSSNDDISVSETPVIKKDEDKEKVTMLYEEEAAEEEEHYVLEDIENSKARRTMGNKKSKNKGSSIKPLTLDKAISEFKEKNFQIAINLLDSLVLESKSENHYKAQWYKALSYIGLDKPLKAKIILNELIEVENSYQAKAKRKLKALKVE